MTNQELFDTVVAHARKQNGRAVNDGMCRYRSDDGRKCFAGVLINDLFYKSNLEGLSAQFSLIQNALVNSGVRRNQLPLVWDLQRIHDRSAVSEWPTQFMELAAKQGLIYADDPS